MKIFRIQTQDGVFYACDDNGAYRVITLDLDTGDISETKDVYAPEDVSLLAPSRPTKIVAVGLNYKAHGQEMNEKLPDEPLIFIKPSSAVLKPFGTIVKPAMSSRVDYEAELGVVIKKTCSQIKAADASDYILGYTCLNDVTARDLQSKDGQWTRAKGFDTFCPFGPYIETDYDWQSKRVTAELNGKIVQDSDTRQMIFSVEALIAFISNVMTLNPGDVIATGTPAGIGPMQKGDTIRISVEGLGVLENAVG